jgi:RHS repeat-associated protein
LFCNIGKHYECTNGVCKKYVFAGSQRIAVKTNTDTWYYHPDHLGSSSIVTDSTGNKSEAIYYYPYGGTRQDTGSVSVKHKFTGQELDDETGLYYYGARYYDPQLGRFISADSIVQAPFDPQTLNRYSYCRNNPIIYSDPSGHWFGIDDLIAAAVGAVIGGTMAGINGGDILQGAAIGAASAWVAWNTCGAATDQLLTQVVENFWTGQVYSTVGYGTAYIGGGAVGGMAGGALAGGMSAAFNGGNVFEGMGMGALTGGIMGGLGGAIGYYGRGLDSMNPDWGSYADNKRAIDNLFSDSPFGSMPTTSGLQDMLGDGVGTNIKMAQSGLHNKNVFEAGSGGGGGYFGGGSYSFRPSVPGYYPPGGGFATNGNINTPQILNTSKQSYFQGIANIDPGIGWPKRLGSQLYDTFLVPVAEKWSKPVPLEPMWVPVKE